jgi:hypothetical protein
MDVKLPAIADRFQREQYPSRLAHFDRLPRSSALRSNSDIGHRKAERVLRGPKATLSSQRFFNQNRSMPTLLLKPVDELTEQDFVEHSVWVAYYEPDELDDLQRLGIDKELARLELGALSDPDRYVFPLPREAVVMPFNYLYVRADLTTAGGKKLIGYVTGPCVGVFHEGQEYLFNRGAYELSKAASRRLASALWEDVIFPLQIEIPVTGKISDFTLD